jgi:heat shock protein HslJ
MTRRAALSLLEGVTRAACVMSLAAAPVLALVLAVTPAGAAERPLPSLAGSEWGLPGEPKVYIQFRNGRAAGFAGCNRFSGRYAYEAGQLTIGPLAVTRKACRPAVMETERRFLDVMAATRRAAATHLVLSLLDAGGATLATLQRRDWD